MKTNDKIPADEMLLAEAIAAAKARGWTGTVNALFRNHRGIGTAIPSRHTVACCAIAALRIAGFKREAREEFYAASFGNDYAPQWGAADGADYGESLGWAFRCAMEDQ